MPLSRHVLALLALAGVAAVAPTADAPARTRKPPADVGPYGEKLQHFLVTFEETRTISWKEPAAWTVADCAGKRYSEAHGSESVKLKTRKPVPAIVYGRGKTAAIVFNVRKLGDVQNAATIGGMVEREMTERGWLEDATCPPPPPPPPGTPKDCGTRLPSYLMMLSLQGSPSKLGIGVSPDPDDHANDQAGFQNCRLRFPRTMRDQLQPDLQRVPVADLLNPRKPTISFSFNKPYTDQAPPKARPWSVEARQSWKLVFTRQR